MTCVTFSNPVKTRKIPETKSELLTEIVPIFSIEILHLLM